MSYDKTSSMGSFRCLIQVHHKVKISRFLNLHKVDAQSLGQDASPLHKMGELFDIPFKYLFFFFNTCKLSCYVPVCFLKVWCEALPGGT